MYRCEIGIRAQQHFDGQRRVFHRKYDGTPAFGAKRQVGCVQQCGHMTGHCLQQVAVRMHDLRFKPQVAGTGYPAFQQDA